MSQFRLLSQILRGQFLIDGRYADGYLPMVANLLTGNTEAFTGIVKESASASHAFIKEGNSFIRVDNERDLKEGAVAVMGITGPVMKEDFCGDIGTSTLREQLKYAANNKRVGAIIMKLSTGGGAVDGTFELADEIREIAKTKPVIGFVDGISASAGYAIQSGCTKIFASHKTAEIGSIGVCATIRDYSGKLKAMGVEEHYINATTAPDKNKDYRQALKGNYEGMEEGLDKLHQIFIDTVKQGRKSKLNAEANPFTGKVYFAEEAQAIGLIDGIFSFEDALNEAYDLGMKKKLLKTT
jgi:protease IV